MPIKQANIRLIKVRMQTKLQKWLQEVKTDKSAGISLPSLSVLEYILETQVV